MVTYLKKMEIALEEKWGGVILLFLFIPFFHDK
jgi:hypothetical protein